MKNIVPYKINFYFFWHTIINYCKKNIQGLIFIHNEIPSFAGMKNFHFPFYTENSVHYNSGISLLHKFQKYIQKILVKLFFVIIFLLGLFFPPCFAQTESDSINNLLKTIPEKEKAKELNALSERYLNESIDFSLVLANQALEMARQYKDRKEEANAYSNIGNIYSLNGNKINAIEYFEKALTIREKLVDSISIAETRADLGICYSEIQEYNKALENYKVSLRLKQALKNEKGTGKTYYNIGIVYLHWGKYDSMIICFQKALKIFEKIQFKQGISYCYLAFGLYYEDWDQPAEALKNYKMALRMEEKMNNETGIANALHNIGNIYFFKFKKSEPDTARIYFMRALEIRRKNSDLLGIAQTLNCLGLIDIEKGNQDLAYERFGEARKISQQIGNLIEFSISLSGIGAYNVKQKKYKEALTFFFRSLHLADSLGLDNIVKENYKLVSDAYSAMGNFQKAYEYYQSYTQMKDTLFTKEKSMVINKLIAQYETEKKDNKIKLQQSELAKKNAVLKQKEIQNTAYVIVIILVLFILVIILRSYILKNKANKIITGQKEEITKKNNEITDSIKAAEFIQKALLPPDEIYTRHFNANHFIFFKPKDIVSGDFHWIRERNNDNNKDLIIVCADCTGHGVSGAFMSLLGMTFMDEIIDNNPGIRANEILNQLRSKVIESLRQTGKQGETKDGMDIAICILDYKTNTIQFSGAINSLYFVRANDKKMEIQSETTTTTLSPCLSTEQHSLFEISADRVPVGYHYEGSVTNLFTNNIWQLRTGDTLYLLSDGFADQFGGPKNKKFKYKPLIELFINNQDKSMQQQKDILEKTLAEWKGNLEQTDDILIIGIRIDLLMS